MIDLGNVLYLAGDPAGLTYEDILGVTRSADVLGTIGWWTMDAAVVPTSVIEWNVSTVLQVALAIERLDAEIQVRLSGRYALGDSSFSNRWVTIDLFSNSQQATGLFFPYSATGGDFLITGNHVGITALRVEARRVGGTAAAGNSVKAAILVV